MRWTAPAAATFSEPLDLPPSALAAPLAALPVLASAIDHVSRALGETDLAAVIENLEADTRGLAILGIGNRNVRQLNGGFLGDDAAFLGLGLLLVTLHQIDARDHGLAFFRHDQGHFTLAALVTAGEHDDLVALLDLGGHYNTSGASEMIFMWFLARNSRGTGPKMRVPTGSICGLISTAALRSNRMIEPSGRRMSLATRTTTAFITSPFLTRPRGIASLTDTTMTS